MDDSFFKPLSTIQKVEASPYLLTRIHQRIRNLETEQVPAKVVWALGLSFIFLICFNWMVMTRSQSTQSTPVKEWVHEIELQTSNNLY